MAWRLQGLRRSNYSNNKRRFDIARRNNGTEKIGEFLVKIGAIKKWQVEDILIVQQSGDTRMFGKIAIAFGYIDDKALMQYVESRGQKSRGESQERRLHVNPARPQAPACLTPVCGRGRKARPGAS